MTDVPSNLVPTRITQLQEYDGDSQDGYLPYVINGRTYKVRFGNVASAGEVPPTREIATGTGLTGGGDLSANRTIAIANGGVGTDQLADNGVTAGSYGAADETLIVDVDAKGRVSSISSTPIVLSNYVPTSRTLTAGAGLDGGGNLSADRTLSVLFSSTSPLALGVADAGVSDVAAREDHVHPALDLSDTTQTEGVLPLGRGGTGVALSPAAGAIVYSTGSELSLTSAGLPGQVLISNGTAGPSWSSSAGTVSSVDVSGGTTGVTFSGGPITSSGTITMGGTLNVASGGTGATTAASARINLGVPSATGGGASGTWGIDITGNAATVTNGVYTTGTYSDPSWLTSLDGGKISGDIGGNAVNVTGTVAIAHGGTGATSAISARINLLPSYIGNGGKVLAVNSGATDVEWIAIAGTGTVTSVDVSGGTTGLTFTGGPVTAAGTITMGGTLAVLNGGTGATTASGARANLGAAASGANSDITSLSGVTGSIASPTYIQFGNGSAVALAAGRMWYDPTTGAFNLGMGNGNITQQVGEEIFVYGKASAAITDSPLRIVYQTGTVGASGVVTFAPTVSGITNGDLIIGVATESLATNAFGRVTAFGVIHGIDTSGAAYGEAWSDGDMIWYNPTTGNPTNIKPTAPNIKVSVGIIINASGGGSGSIQVSINHGSVLGGTDSNVQLTSVANNDLLQYSSSLGYWRNLAASSVTVGTATNLAGGAANRIAYQTGAGATGFIAAPTVANTFLEWSGSAFQWSANPLGTVTSVAFSTGTTGLSVSGSPITTSGTITLSGTLNVANGGTGATTLTGLVVGNGTSAFTTVTAPSGTVVGTTDTQTLTNKDIVERVVALADATSITPNADTTDIGTQANTQAAGTLTVNAPTGTPVDGQKLIVRLTCTNAQTFSFNAIYAGSTDLALPTATSGAGKTDYLGFIYNSTAAKWQLLAKNFGF